MRRFFIATSLSILILVGLACSQFQPTPSVIPALETLQSESTPVAISSTIETPTVTPVLTAAPTRTTATTPIQTPILLLPTVTHTPTPTVTPTPTLVPPTPTPTPITNIVNNAADGGAGTLRQASSWMHTAATSSILIERSSHPKTHVYHPDKRLARTQPRKSDD